MTYDDLKPLTKIYFIIFCHLILKVQFHLYFYLVLDLFNAKLPI